MNLMRGCWLLRNEHTHGWDVGRNCILLFPPHATDFGKDVFALCVKDGVREAEGFALPIESTARATYGVPRVTQVARFLGADGTLLERSHGIQSIVGSYVPEVFGLSTDCVDEEQDYVAVYVRKVGG